MRESGESPDAFFALHRHGADAEGALAEALAGYEPVGNPLPDAPPSLVIEEVEALWSAIDERDDWQPLHDRIAAIRALGEALGSPPVARGHSIDESRSWPR